MAAYADIKVGVYGSAAVGKTSVTDRIVFDQFDRVYDPTIEDSYRKQMLVDENIILFDFLDTSNMEGYMDQAMQQADVALYVYSITDPDSFGAVGTLNEELRRVRDLGEGDPPYPAVVFANKSDLDSERAVDTAEGVSLAESIGAKFLEGSAKQRINIDEAASECARAYIEATEGLGGKNNKKKGAKPCALM